ncbi:hypothetical protein CLAIMM_06785 [Cladophialophora immunda]|nr:hypothetical protein CLAIMM_06785 [Cladophialophora immunda]
MRLRVRCAGVSDYLLNGQCHGDAMETFRVVGAEASEWYRVELLTRNSAQFLPMVTTPEAGLLTKSMKRRLIGQCKRTNAPFRSWSPFRRGLHAREESGRRCSLSDGKE